MTTAKPLATPGTAVTTASSGPSQAHVRKGPRAFYFHPFLRNQKIKLVVFHVVLVALLLMFYAGFGDAVSSLMTSTLKDCWQRSFGANCFGLFPDLPYLLAILAFLGAGFGLALLGNSFWFWIGLMVGSASILFGGLYVASSMHGDLPWPFVLAAFLSSALYTFRVKTHYELVAGAKIRASFGNQVSEVHLKRILRYPFHYTRAPASRLVTLMRVGYADFSNTAETLSPAEAFSELQRLTHLIKSTVHKFGGNIAALDGDAALAFFGYTFDGQEESDFRVDEALTCAVEILQASLKESLDAAGRGKVFCPLRVTLNTTSVYFGDIGDEETWNLILMGPGVSLTQQLEESCDEFRVLMTATTRDLIRTFDPTSLTISRRFLQIRHHRELIEAYDADPFVKDAEAISKVLGQYREMVSIQRKEPRWPVPSDTPVSVGSDFGSGALVNFSLSGLAVKMGVYLARGVEVSIQLESEDGKLQKLLEQKGLGAVAAEVRWAKLADDTFIHGLRLKNLTAEQRVNVMNALRDHVRGKDLD